MCLFKEYIPDLLFKLYLLSANHYIFKTNNVQPIYMYNNGNSTWQSWTMHNQATVLLHHLRKM